MNHWNYRVWQDKYDTLSIRETYYNDEGKIDSWHAKPSSPIGTVDEETTALDSLRWTLEHMLKSLDKPIINEADYESVIDSDS